MIFTWFGFVHLPRTLAGVSDRLAVFEALAAAGIALVIAGYSSERRRDAGSAGLRAP